MYHGSTKHVLLIQPHITILDHYGGNEGTGCWFGIWKHARLGGTSSMAENTKCTNPSAKCGWWSNLVASQVYLPDHFETLPDWWSKLRINVACLINKSVAIYQTILCQTDFFLVDHMIWNRPSNCYGESTGRYDIMDIEKLMFVWDCQSIVLKWNLSRNTQQMIWGFGWWWVDDRFMMLDHRI